MKTYGKLTTKQKEVLEYIKSFCATNKYPPSVREICHGVGVNSPATIHTHIKKLSEKGYISRGENGNKQLKLLVTNEYENGKNEIKSVPLIGKKRYDNPLDALEKPDEYFAIPTYLIPQRKEVFTLRVNNDDMINIGICQKDIIIAERCKSAKNGELVIAITDDNKIVFRRLTKDKGYYTLDAENDFVNPIVITEPNILGKPISLYRNFKKID